MSPGHVIQNIASCLVDAEPHEIVLYAQALKEVGEALVETQQKMDQILEIKTDE